MSQSEKGYKYTIPLDTTGSARKSLYSPGSEGERLKVHYKANTLVVVQTKPSPHFHKDSVNVEVEEVDLDDYKQGD